DRMAQASERVSRPGARQDLVRDGAIRRAARDREPLVAVERMVVERTIDEPETRRLVDHGDDPRRVERPEAEVVHEHADRRADPDRGAVRHDLEPADADRVPAADGLACMVEARIVATEDDAVIVDLVARGPDRRRQRRGRLAREPAIDGRAGRSPREEHRTWASAPATRVSAPDSMGATSGAAAHRFLRPRASTAFLNSSTESRSAFCSNGRRSGPGTQKPMSTACEQ